MKKPLLLLFLAVLVGLSANAQCTPDPQYTNAGVYPDSATGLNAGCVGVLYEQLITIVVPVDTTTEVGGIPVTLSFDSAVVVSFTGLPAGFTYACYDAGNTNSPVDQCAYEGGTTGCMLISGTPTAGDIGTHNLSIEVAAFVGGTPTPVSQNVDYYSIVISDCASLEEYETTVFKLSPNPTRNNLTLSGLEGLDVSSLSISNAAGQTVKQFGAVQSPSVDMNVAELQPGMYFVRIQHDERTNVIRFVKE